METVFDTRIENDVATLRVIGDTAIRERVAPLRDAVADLVQHGARTVVIDLSTARWVGAAMLGELVAAMQTATRSGGRLLLSRMPRRARRALAAARLDAVLPTADTPQA